MLGSIHPGCSAHGHGTACMLHVLPPPPPVRSLSSVASALKEII